MHCTSRALRATLLSCLATLAVPAMALTVVGTAVNLPDSTPGQDLWRYDLTVNGVFANNDKLDIAFSDSLYSILTNLDSPPSFSVSITQQPLAGINYGATYTGAGPSAASNFFSLSLVRTATTLPTGLSFGFTPFGQATQFGQATITAATVPESSTLSMLALGLLSMAFLRRRQGT